MARCTPRKEAHRERVWPRLERRSGQQRGPASRARVLLHPLGPHARALHVRNDGVSVMAYELGTWTEDVLESRASWQRHPRGHARVHERARQIAAPWDARASAEPRLPLWPLDHLLRQRSPADAAGRDHVRGEPASAIGTERPLQGRPIQPGAAGPRRRAARGLLVVRVHAAQDKVAERLRSRGWRCNNPAPADADAPRADGGCGGGT